MPSATRLRRGDDVDRKRVDNRGAGPLDRPRVHFIPIPASGNRHGRGAIGGRGSLAGAGARRLHDVHLIAAILREPQACQGAAAAAQMNADALPQNKAMVVAAGVVHNGQAGVLVAAIAEAAILMRVDGQAVPKPRRVGGADGDVTVGRVMDADATGVDLRRCDGGCSDRPQDNGCQGQQGRSEKEKLAVHRVGPF